MGPETRGRPENLLPRGGKWGNLPPRTPTALLRQETRQAEAKEVHSGNGKRAGLHRSEEVMRPPACKGFFRAAPVGRREFLRAGSVGLFGLGLPELLAARTARTPTVQRGKARACILLFMWGGPAQQDTWDPKPSAPEEYRGQFKTIPTTL